MHCKRIALAAFLLVGGDDTDLVVDGAMVEAGGEA